jgi:hypothetical protein
VRVAAVAVGLSTIAAAGVARAGVDDGLAQVRVVFAREGALWVTDAKGKTKAVAVATLPAGTAATDVHMIPTSAAGDRVLVDIGGTWFWTALAADGGVATLTELPCGAGTARLSARGASVLCAAPDGRARMVRLSDARVFDRDAPAANASLVVRGDVRSLAWVDNSGHVTVAPVVQPSPTPPAIVAPEAPVRGFLAAPDGSRGVGVYRAKPFKPKDAPERDELFGFALDGVAAKRRLIRDGVVIDWSWDSHWLLVQDGDKACIARATGGQFKCWKGFTAMSIAPDGAYALVLGPRSGAAGAVPEDKEKEKEKESGGEGGGEGEGGAEEEEAAAGEASALPKGPLSLYRARLSGPYTERPALVETVVDGAAVWLAPFTFTSTPTSTPTLTSTIKSE